MPTPKNFCDFVNPRCVSVWIGEFRSEDEFDSYLVDSFSSDFGFEIPQQAVHEIGVEPKNVDIATLVDGFSRSKTFESQVVNAAESCGISRASCMLLIYNFAYTPAVELSANPPIKFVGCVSFPGFE
jgi:hypothetical protein